MLRMTRGWLSLCFAVCCLCPVLARSEDSSPADLKYKSAIQKADKAHEEALADARAGYITALKEQMSEETKKGSLDAAVATRDKIKKLEAIGKDSQPILKKLAGTNWVNSNSVAFQWKDDGTFYHNGKERPCFALDAQRVAVVFGNSHIDILQFDEKFTKFDQFNTKGSDKPIMTGKKTTIR